MVIFYRTGKVMGGIGVFFPVDHMGDMGKGGKVVQHGDNLFALLPVGGYFLAQPVQPLSGIIGAHRFMDSKEDIKNGGGA